MNKQQRLVLTVVIGAIALLIAYGVYIRFGAMPTIWALIIVGLPAYMLMKRLL